MVGYGKMGAALLSQWQAAAGRPDADHQFTVIDPAVDPAAASPFPAVTFVQQPPAPDACAFDLVIVAVKPQLVDAVLPLYADRLAQGGFVASIAAGCSLARLRALAGGVPVVRIMPNLPAAIGAGVSGLCADPTATPEQRAAVQQLAEAVGTAVWVADEDQLDRLTAVAGSGPGYGFEIARSYVAAAQAIGFDAATAKQLVLGTLAGTIEMAKQSPLELDALRTSVTSKNGTTAAGLAALNGDGTLDQLLQATLDAAYARAVELR
ncbi:pyrroline-5-carboxylate reductase family protein [Sphingomonas sp. ac-8]|uniref:pyrroline-5-carboxylate reductase family protein n=1 Tax=Sphingomonas sp. ac-8 TaxID=3242977 RepID=UPI003A80C800